MWNFCVSLNCVDCVKWCSHRRCTCTICNTQSFCVLTTPKQPARSKQKNGNGIKSNQSKKLICLHFQSSKCKEKMQKKNPTNTQFCLTNIMAHLLYDVYHSFAIQDFVINDFFIIFKPTLELRCWCVDVSSVRCVNCRPNVLLDHVKEIKWIDPSHRRESQSSERVI